MGEILNADEQVDKCLERLTRQNMNEGLELYKLCCTSDNKHRTVLVDELGWISNSEFCVWVSYLFLGEFMEGLTAIFGNGIYDDGGFDANMQEDGVCIDLCQAIGEIIDLSEVFPKKDYKH